MNDRDSRLHQFFTGYFNQDWDVDGATSWSDVVDHYLAENGSAHASRLRDDLRSWLSEAGETSLPDAFGCDYDPRTEGMDSVAWVRALADYVHSKLASPP